MNRYKLFFYPILAIGLTMILLGVRWLIVDEPWLLDEVANVERVDMTFDELFESEINGTLPGYLRQIYRFFGFWVIIIGLFIVSFSTPSLVKNKGIRCRLLICLGIMMLMGTILGHTLIPSSHFIFLGWAMIAAFSISLFAFYKIHYTNNG